MNKFYVIMSLLLFPFFLKAQENTTTDFQGFDKVVPSKANRQFQAFVYFYQQSVAMNIAPENEFLKGQIVGRLFGGNTTTTSNKFTALYADNELYLFSFIHRVYLMEKLR